MVLFSYIWLIFYGKLVDIVGEYLDVPLDVRKW